MSTDVTDSVLGALRAVVGAAGYIDRSPGIDPYLVDFRHLYRGQSPLVLLPANTEEVARIVRICAEHGVGIVPHGGNTGYCGGATPDESGTQIVLALKRLSRIRKLEPLEHAITVEAGCVLAQVQTAAEQAERFFPLSLGSEGSCQIGGVLATNAGGTAVLRYGMMRDLTLGLEVVLADGQVLDGLKSLRKDNSGYDLKDLFIGSEGTLGIITAACLKLFPLPHDKATAMAAVPDPAAAVELLGRLRAASGDALSAFELIPRLGIELTTRHISGAGDPFDRAYDWYVLIEIVASRAGSGVDTLLEDALADSARNGWVHDAVLTSNLQQRKTLWRLRETIPEAQRLAGASIKHDLSVPITSIPEFVRRATDWVNTHVPEGEVLAYGHLGDGNLHFNIQQRPGADAASFLKRAPAIHDAVYPLVAEYRGSFSAEHGIGRLKIPELLRYKSAPEIAVMRAIKRTLDPQGILNPGKVLNIGPAS
jgi:FAD/FMN-containing dehydrogenase